jgi:hypothetical protein
MTNHTRNHVVFTPLRIALIIAVALSNGLALISFVFADAPWAYALRVFGIVFIMLFAFVILLEFTWLHHRGKHVKGQPEYSTYQLAKWLYAGLFLLGVSIGLFVLLS